MRIAHVFCHQATNLGDIYLRRGTRDAFRALYPDAVFTDVETRRLFTDGDVEQLNRHDLVVIGGGGLLLRDTFPNTVSDWQLGMTREQVDAITAPLVVHAIGYNRFRGQEDFARPLFDRHMTGLVDRSAWFTVRNHGSARALRRYVPEALGGKIRVNPCPSLAFPRVVADRPLGTRRVGLLLAGDRLERRHPDMDGFGRRLRKLMEEIFALNTFSAMLITSRMLPLLRKGTDPSVVFLTSVAARTGAPGATIYGSCKGALDSLTRGLAKELAPEIRVNAVAPGVIETPFHEKVTSPERMKQFAESAPLGRNGQATSIAQTIRFIIENDFMTGETVDVNGGMYMR